MRVLYLVPDFYGPGGIARHSRVMCQALIEAGLRLDVVALNDASSPKRKNGSSNDTSAELLTFPQMNYLSCDGNRKIFVRHALALARQRPTLILVEHANFSPLGWLVARRARALLMIVAHGIEVWEPLSRVRRWALRRADRIICVSRFTSHQAGKANNIPPQNIRILHNCLDPHFKFQNVPHQVSHPIMLTVARTSLAEQYKGHDFVIRALPQLLLRFPTLTYHIIGDGDGRPQLQELAKQQGVEGAIRWSAQVSEADLLSHYAHATLFIMPSRGEGFGLVFVEAMAQGLPTIGGNIDATPEVITDGETGYVVDPTSIEAITEAASRILSDPQLRERMRQAALAHVEREFNYTKFQRTLLFYLSELGMKFPPN